MLQRLPRYPNIAVSAQTKDFEHAATWYDGPLVAQHGKFYCANQISDKAHRTGTHTLSSCWRAMTTKKTKWLSCGKTQKLTLLSLIHSYSLTMNEGIVVCKRPIQRCFGRNLALCDLALEKHQDALDHALQASKIVWGFAKARLVGSVLRCDNFETCGI